MVPLADLPVALSLTAPWSDASVRVVGDLDADGWTDAVVHLRSGAESLGVVLRGPLHEPHVLPEDAWGAASSGWPSWFFFGETTGDGVPDLFLVDHYQGETWLVPGPYEGSLEPTADAVALPYYESHPDVDHDGVIDGGNLVEAPDGTVGYGVTFGPLTDRTGPADLLLAPLCRDRHDTVQYPWSFPGDLDLDGYPEVGFPTGWLCPGFSVPVPRSGVVDLGTVATNGELDGAVVEDRTGDGLPEYYDNQGIWLSPLALDAGGIVGERVDFDEDVTWIVPAPFDADGDSRRDWLVLLATGPYPSPQLLAVVTDAHGLAAVDPVGFEAPPPSFEGVAIVSWADAGAAHALLKDGSVWRLAELGTAY